MNIKSKLFRECDKVFFDDEKIIDRYFYELDKVFKLIQKCEDGYNVKKLLRYPTSISGFERLN